MVQSVTNTIVISTAGEHWPRRDKFTDNCSLKVQDFNSFMEKSNIELTGEQLDRIKRLEFKKASAISNRLDFFRVMRRDVRSRRALALTVTTQVSRCLKRANFGC